MNAKWILIFGVLIAFTAAVLVFGRTNLAQVADWQARLQAQSSHTPRQYLVVYTNGVFSPTNLRVRIGDAVSFQNESAAPIRLEEFRSEVIASKSSFLYTFVSEGTFAYANAMHPDERGIITVRP